jgi:hypothetical protein
MRTQPFESRDVFELGRHIGALALALITLVLGMLALTGWAIYALN